MIKGLPVHEVAVRMGKEEREEKTESLQTKGLGVCVCVVEQGGGWIPAEKTWIVA